MKSDIFGEKYNEYINEKLKYFLPDDYSFEEEEDKKCNTRSALRELKDITLSEHEKIFTLDNEIFYKGLTSEIIGFYKKMEKQLLNVKKLNDEFDYTWNYVSEYYLSFFAITTLTRFNGEFIIFLSEDEASGISNVASTYLGEPIKIKKGQYVLKIVQNDYEKREVKLSLRTKKDTHASAWNLFYSLITNYKNLGSSKESKEDNLISTVHRFFSEQNNILSISRNDLNYKYQFGFDEINHHTIYGPINWETSFEIIQAELFKLPTKPEIEDCVKNILLINYFLIEFLTKIYRDFLKRIDIQG